MPTKSLIQILADVEPRERGGPRGSAGFSYQKLWAICEIVDRHERGVDYLAVFDFHDDFVLVLPDTDELHFYQIKKRDDGKHWTLPKLLHRKTLKSGGHELSIMAKLVEHQIRFAGAAASINFVSNARFSLKLHDSSKSTERDAVCVVDISAADRDAIRTQLAGEHDPAPLPNFEGVTHLRVTDLSVGDAERHAAGKLGDYLSRRTPGRAYDVPPLIRTLVSQITRRSDYAGAVTSAADVLDRKAIARADLERWLQLAGVAADPAHAMRAIEQMLSASVPFTRIKRLRKEIRRYQVERLDVGNRDIRYLRFAVLKALSLLGEIQVLADVIRSVDEDAALRTKFDDVFGHDYVVAAALLEAYEDHELPAAGEEPEEETE